MVRRTRPGISGFRVRANARPGMTNAFEQACSIELKLQEALRIDVDFKLEIALGLWTGGEPFAQIFRQIDIAQRFHQEPETIAALDHRERCFGRPQYLDPLVDRGDRPTAESFARRLAAIAPMDGRIQVL